MIDLIGATEGQKDSEKKLTGRVYKSPGATSYNDGVTPSPAHDDGVVQGLADGHIAVIGHPCEDEDFNASKEVKDK